MLSLYHSVLAPPLHPEWSQFLVYIAFFAACVWPNANNFYKEGQSVLQLTSTLEHSVAPANLDEPFEKTACREEVQVWIKVIRVLGLDAGAHCSFDERPLRWWTCV